MLDAEHAQHREGEEARAIEHNLPVGRGIDEADQQPARAHAQPAQQHQRHAAGVVGIVGRGGVLHWRAPGLFLGPSCSRFAAHP